MTRLDSQFECGGVRIFGGSHAEILSLVDDGADGAGGLGGRVVHLCNAYTIVCASRDEEVARALQAAFLNIPDGVPVARLGRWHAALCRDGAFRGPDLMTHLLAREDDARHYFFGSQDTTLEALSTATRWLGSRNVGHLSPPYGRYSPDDLDGFARVLEDARPTFVWVGLGTPKQDVVAQELADRYPDPIYICVGAAFDFLSGSKSSAPSWLQGTGFEWLHRLVTEPRRLWRRYTIDSVKFLYLALPLVRRRRRW